MFYFKFLILIVGVICLINGCSKQLPISSHLPSQRQVNALSSSTMRLVKNPYRLYLKGDDLSKESLIASIQYSLDYLNRISPDSVFEYGKIKYTAREVITSFEIFLNVINSYPEYDQLISELEELFYLFGSSANDDNGVMFTGYYEPIFRGSLKKSKKYSVPVYGKPNDLLVLELGDFRDSLQSRTIVYRLQNNQILPYHSREEIMSQGALNKKAEVLAWMADPIDLFFTQVQGSGIVKLEDGTLLRLGYNGSNGHNYSSIGKYLVDNEIMELEKVSMGSIRQYLTDNPSTRDKVLYHNKSYTFFSIDKDTRGPKGNINVPLTPNRSIATDSMIFPKSALTYIDAEMPVFKDDWSNATTTSFSRFSVIQDTGGAIKGPGRVDLFWGNGELAERSAGRMRSFGKLYFLIAKKLTIRDHLINQP